uniref:Uncharacterized protein n=1 Tax=Lepeophtheirus salmonis TaxID=72036 RepID=A0A0K2U7F8_LEPSM
MIASLYRYKTQFISCTLTLPPYILCKANAQISKQVCFVTYVQFVDASLYLKKNTKKNYTLLTYIHCLCTISNIHILLMNNFPGVLKIYWKDCICIHSTIITTKPFIKDYVRQLIFYIRLNKIFIKGFGLNHDDYNILKRS